MRPRKSAFQVQSLKSRELRSIKIRVVVVIPRFHHQHIFSSRSQLRRRNSAARAGSNHTNVACKRSFFLWHNHFQSTRSRWPLHSQRSGKSNLLPDAARPAAFRQHHVQKSNRFPQRLERRSPLPQRTISPRPQHSFAHIPIQFRKMFVLARQQKSVQLRIPNIQQIQELRAIPRPWIEFQRVLQRCGDTHFHSRGPPVTARKKCFANCFQCVLLAESQLHGEGCSLARHSRQLQSCNSLAARRRVTP